MQDAESWSFCIQGCEWVLYLANESPPSILVTTSSSNPAGGWGSQWGEIRQEIGRKSQRAVGGGGHWETGVRGGDQGFKLEASLEEGSQVRPSREVLGQETGSALAHERSHHRERGEIPGQKRQDHGTHPHLL